MKPQLPFSSAIRSSRSFMTSPDGPPAWANAADTPASASAPPNIRERLAVIFPLPTLSRGAPAARPVTGPVFFQRRHLVALVDGDRAACPEGAARGQLEQRRRHARDLRQPVAARVLRRHRA